VDYLSPEYIENGIFDERSDIFALGMVAFRLIAGRTPAEGADVFETLQMRVRQDVPSVAAFRPECPVVLVEFVAKALARDPAQRFQSVREMLTALATAHAAPPVLQRPASLTAVTKPITVPPARSKPSAMSRMFVTLVLLAGVARIVYLTFPEVRYLADAVIVEAAPPAPPAPVVVVAKAEVAAEPVALAAPTRQGLTHRVRYKGETLAVISLWYTGKLDNWRLIAKANPDLNFDRIEIGQQFFIPTELLKQSAPLTEANVKTIIRNLKASRAKIVKVAQPVKVPVSVPVAPTEVVEDALIEY